MYKFELETIIETLIYLHKTEDQLLNIWDEENENNHVIDELNVYNYESKQILIDLVETNIKTKVPRKYFKTYSDYEKFLYEIYSGKYSPEEVINIYDNLTLKGDN